MLTLYNVVSADWYSADIEGGEDFIPDAVWPETLKIIAKFDVLVMGSKTNETVQKYSPALRGPFEALPIQKIVVSRNHSYPLVPGYALAATPEEAIAACENTLVSSGETLNDYLFSKDLVDRVILHQLPVVLGEGKNVFNPNYRARLHLQSEVDLGLVRESIYTVDI